MGTEDQEDPRIAIVRQWILQRELPSRNTIVNHSRRPAAPSEQEKDWPERARVYNSARFGYSRLHPHRLLMKQQTLSEATRKKLERAARKVMRNAHAPYSKFRVGAAILLTNGKVFSGCNVENASYGMTNCAERTAIFSAVAQFGPKIEIRAVAVANDHSVACSPCGACRQVIYEFGPDATIFFQGAKGPKQAHITELLPEGFRLL
jgi:cytidine deaminase